MGEVKNWIITGIVGVSLGTSASYMELKYLESQIPKFTQEQKNINLVINKNLTEIQELEERGILFSSLPTEVRKDIPTVEDLTDEVLEDLKEKDLIPEKPKAEKMFLSSDTLSQILETGYNANPGIKVDFIRAGLGLLNALRESKDTVSTDDVQLYKSSKELLAKGIDLDLDVSNVREIKRYGGVTELNLKGPMKQSIPKGFGSSLEILTSKLMIYDSGNNNYAKAVFPKNKVKFKASGTAKFGGFLTGKKIADAYVDVVEIRKSGSEYNLTITGRQEKNNMPYRIAYNLTSCSIKDFKGYNISAEQFVQARGVSAGSLEKS